MAGVSVGTEMILTKLPIYIPPQKEIEVRLNYQVRENLNSPTAQFCHKSLYHTHAHAHAHKLPGTKYLCVIPVYGHNI